VGENPTGDLQDFRGNFTHSSLWDVVDCFKPAEEVSIIVGKARAGVGRYLLQLGFRVSATLINVHIIFRRDVHRSLMVLTSQVPSVDGRLLTNQMFVLHILIALAPVLPKKVILQKMKLLSVHKNAI
jgi:hypothetical protein